MSTFSSKCGFAIVVTVLGLSCPAAHAQSEPVRYWVPFGPFGFGSGAIATSAETYGSYPAFSAADPEKSGFVFRSYSAPVSALTSGFGWTGVGGPAAFSSLDSLSYESTQFGYNFKGAGDLPTTVFGGVDTLKYDSGIGAAFGPFDTTSSTAAGYTAHAGIEFRPTSNLSLSLGASFSQQQQSNLVDSDINSSLPPGASPLAFGHR